MVSDKTSSFAQTHILQERKDRKLRCCGHGIGELPGTEEMSSIEESTMEMFLIVSYVGVYADYASGVFTLQSI